MLELTSEEGEQRVILIDTSPDLRQQAIRHHLRRCDAILFTHHHVDHIFGLDEVRQFNARMKASIPIFAEATTFENLQRVFLHIFEPHRNDNESFVASLIPNIVKPMAPFELFGLRITPLRLLHGRMPILGYRIEWEDASLADADDVLPLAYCTDVSAIPPETYGHLTGLDTLVLDALRYRHHPTHFNVEQALAAAEQVGAKRTLLIHMTHDILHADLEKRLPEGVRPAYDGLTLGGRDGQRGNREPGAVNGRSPA